MKLSIMNLNAFIISDTKIKYNRITQHKMTLEKICGINDNDNAFETSKYTIKTAVFNVIHLIDEVWGAGKLHSTMYVKQSYW
jgi:hypothetical protein